MALAGSRWLVMKNAEQSLTLETWRRRRRRVVSRRKSERKVGDERGEDKGGGVEVEERNIMNRETTRTRGGWEPELQTDRQAGRQASESSPERCRGARQRIRAVYPLCLGLLHGDNTRYESFMRGAFLY